MNSPIRELYGIMDGSKEKTFAALINFAAKCRQRLPRNIEMGVATQLYLAAATIVPRQHALDLLLALAQTTANDQATALPIFAKALKSNSNFTEDEISGMVELGAWLMEQGQTLGGEGMDPMIYLDSPGIDQIEERNRDCYSYFGDLAAGCLGGGGLQKAI
jgi:hypothetical protein